MFYHINTQVIFFLNNFKQKMKKEKTEKKIVTK